MKSLRSAFAKASRRRRAIAQTKPWQRLGYGWKARLEHANREIIAAMKAHPRRFKVQIDPHDPETVIVTTTSRRRRTNAETEMREEDYLFLVEQEDEAVAAATKSHPKRFNAQGDTDELSTITEVSPHRRHDYGRPSDQLRQISVRLPKSVFEIKGMNGRKGKKVYEAFFLEMLSRNGKS